MQAEAWELGPEEWRQWFLGQSEAQQRIIAEAAMKARRTAQQCMIENHDPRLDLYQVQMTRQHDELVRERSLILDMERELESMKLKCQEMEAALNTAEWPDTPPTRIIDNINLYGVSIEEYGLPHTGFIVHREYNDQGHEKEGNGAQ